MQNITKDYREFGGAVALAMVVGAPMLLYTIVTFMYTGFEQEFVQQLVPTTGAELATLWLYPVFWASIGIYWAQGPKLGHIVSIALAILHFTFLMYTHQESGPHVLMFAVSAMMCFWTFLDAIFDTCIFVHYHKLSLDFVNLDNLSTSREFTVKHMVQGVEEVYYLEGDNCFIMMQDVSTDNYSVTVVHADRMTKISSIKKHTPWTKRFINKTAIKYLPEKYRVLAENALGDMYFKALYKVKTNSNGV